MVANPMEDTEPHVQSLFHGSYRETCMESQDSAGVGLSVYAPPSFTRLIIFMDKYMIGVWIVGVVSGIVIWGISLFSWGLLGIVFGWIPAVIGGVILGFLWPLTILVALFFIRIIISQ